MARIYLVCNKALAECIKCGNAACKTRHLGTDCKADDNDGDSPNKIF